MALELQYWRDGVRVNRGVHLTEEQITALFQAVRGWRKEPKRQTGDVTWNIPKCRIPMRTGPHAISW